MCVFSHGGDAEGVEVGSCWSGISEGLFGVENVDFLFTAWSGTDVASSVERKSDVEWRFVVEGT